MENFAVFGYPIGHSKSPRIHQLFAEQTGKHIHYDAVLVPLDKFEERVCAFFAAGGKGVNITTPFKERAYKMSDQQTVRATMAGAVNTLKPLDDGTLLGDNTDGIGLLSDLQRLQMIKPDQHILLLGAGGAVRGVLQPLLSLGNHVVVANRTYNRAQNLAEVFAAQGAIEACEIESLSGLHFDLIINGTSSGLQGDIPSIPASVIDSSTRCYDMFYDLQLTPFLRWAGQQGAVHIADGLGMLVGQAAHAFALWQGMLPKIEPVLRQLRQEMSR